MKVSKFRHRSPSWRNRYAGLMPSEVKRLWQLDPVHDQVRATLLYMALGNLLRLCHFGSEHDSWETLASCLSRSPLAQNGGQPGSQPPHPKRLLLIRNGW
jgi:hypothetical protein